VVIVWLSATQYTQVLLLSFTCVQIVVCSVIYNILHHRGQVMIGFYLFSISFLILLAIPPLLIPDMMVPVSIGYVVLISVGSLLLGQNASRWLVGACILAFTADIILVNTVSPDWFTPLEETARATLTISIAFIALLIATVMLRLIVRGQDEQFWQAQLANLDNQKRVIAERKQHEQLQQANLEIEKRAASEQEQRQYLERLVVQIQTTISTLNTASQQINDAADQSAENTQQVAATIQQIAEGTAQQTESITRSMNTVEQLTQAIDGVARGAQEQAASIGQSVELTASISDSTKQVASNAQTGAAGAAQAAETASSGAASIRETLEGMANIREKVDLSAQKVREMGRRSEHIGAIVDTIDNIASQTNLLALNATIEAARAGEHGKGFAVVADEVRKLAEKSADATKEIGGLIRSIQSTISEAMQAMDEGAAEVEVGVTRANQSGQVLDNVLGAVNAVSKQMEDIAEAALGMNTSVNKMVSAMDTVSAIVEENTASTEEMAASADEVSQAFESIASISEENSAATEEVSATTEEVTAQAREVSISSQKLREMAQDLQIVVAQFKL
jgi:methyl-accepting chemotaxis protein